MRQARDLSKKTGEIKGISHAKKGSIRDRSCVGLTEAREVKKRRQEYTEELHKKGFARTENPFSLVYSMSSRLILRTRSSSSSGRLEFGRKAAGLKRNSSYRPIFVPPLF